MIQALEDLQRGKLPYRIDRDLLKWPSTDTDKPNSVNWVYAGNNGSQREIFETEVKFIIDRTLGASRKGLTERDQKHMYRKRTETQVNID
jgi:hypothetical protein